ncbi:glycine betaine transporter OpuD [Parvularcula lutaonensis]|nr:glycine betaine transporter OpuD [Parvularcula lutaonensis]
MFLPGTFSAAIQSLANGFLQSFDRWTLLLPTACLAFCLAVLFLPHGKFVIGGPRAKPEFRRVTWVAMMFAAGMGAGLVFWGSAEPLIHMASPPPDLDIAPNSDEARWKALAITQFHWSLHAWAIYGVAAIAVGMALSGKGPLLPSRPFGGLPHWARRGIDITALVAVLFGLVASLGQGVFQVGAGLATISDGKIPEGIVAQIPFLLLLTTAYLVSAWLGLRRGIAILSNVNIALALALALYVFIVGPTGAIVSAFVDSALSYSANFAELSFRLRPEGEARDWTRAWSLTYFLWWVAWTPFVGVFLARISRGRSLREFVIAAVFVPSAMTLLWFAILGGAALAVQQTGRDLGISDFDTATLAAYVLLDELPLTTLMQGMTIALVTIFLITSADSGAYVLAMFTEETSSPSAGGRVFWGLVLAALTAAAILSEDGQSATRAMAVAGAIPLTFLLAAQGGVAGWRLFGPQSLASAITSSRERPDRAK